MILIFENKKSSKITKREIGYIDRVKIYSGILFIGCVLLIFSVKKAKPL